MASVIEAVTAAEGSGWSSGEVTANGIKHHYWRTGWAAAGKPALVLAHGSTDNGLCWTRLAKTLEGMWDVVMPDARGHGLSEAPDDDYTAAARAADLAALIEALGLVKPVVGGHSMGGSTTLRLAAEHPELVRAAVLEDPGLRDAPRGPEAEADAAARRERMRRSAEEAKAMGKEGLIARQRERTPHWPEDELVPWAESKLQVSERHTTARRGEERPGWRELLPRIQCPTLLITADPEKGAIVTPEMAAEANRLLPSLKVVRIGGAGHSVRRDRFEEYVAAVKEFLKGV